MYSQIAPARFFIGAAIVAAPTLLIESEEWQSRYVVLILVMFTVYNWRGLERFADFIARATRGG